MINKIKCNLKKVDQVLHIADLHIRNWKRHKEYANVFNKLYTAIDKLPVDAIITVGGDIVHAKTDMSPELISVVMSLFKELANRRPTIVICGNHDTNLNNNDRLDALTPIIEAINHPNLFYLRNSGLYEIGDVAISVMSLIDPVTSYVTADQIVDKYKHTIAMYHGTIANSKVDSGLNLAHGLNWDTFASFDLALLGDIHKRQVLCTSDPIIFYPGSLIQQNYGESFDGHGYAICDLTTKGDIKYQFFDIPNPHGFFTADIENGILPDNLPITANTKVRLRTRNTTSAELKRALATIRKLYKNSDVLIQRLDSKMSGDSSFGESLNQGDIRNVQHQNQLITEFLQNQTDDEILAAVLKINTTLNQGVSQGEAVRNVVWKPKKFEFSNMFSYGEGNVVNFDKLNGTCGLFAPNHAGKSAVLDALCFCLFDHSFRASKAEQVLNRKKESFTCKFNFELNGLDYFVEKRATKYAKGPLAGRLRVDIDFWHINAEGEIVSLNGEQRRDTDKIIQSYVGTFDDFILTALSLQGNNSNFIDKTQGERKDLLVNFLDLKIFDTLYDLANKENRIATVLLEEYQKQDFEKKLGDAELLMEESNQKYQEAKAEVTIHSEKLQQLNDVLLELNKRLQPCIADGLDIDVLQRKLNLAETNAESLGQEASKAHLELEDQQIILHESLHNLNIEKSLFDHDLFKVYKEKTQEKVELNNTFSTMKVTIANKLSKLEKLEKHEYDPNCHYCTTNVFVKDAIETRDQLETDKQIVHDFLLKLNDVSSFIEQNKNIQQQADQLQILHTEHKEAMLSAERWQNTYDRICNDSNIQKLKIDKILSDIKVYNDNTTILNSNKEIHAQIKDIHAKTAIKKIDLQKANVIALNYHGKIKVAEQIISDCNKSIKHMQQLAEKQIAYDLYCKAVGKDGIPYIMISKAVPYIQHHVNDILNQVTDFTVELETDGKNINAYISYDNHKWPLELSSGMERFLASLAIRMALIKITNLPKPDFIAIDEGLGVLDSSNLNSMHTLFTYMKDVFRFSLVISHIDVVRDMVDNIITIDRKDDLSHINY